MKKKAISLLLVAAMTATMTAGCGDKQEAADNTTAGNDAAPSTEAAASDDAATEEEEEAWSGTLTVWSPQEDQDTGWLQKECDAFNAAHPNWDVTFEYGVCAEGDAKATVTTDVEGSADVYMLANDNIPDLVAANALAELGGSYLDYVTSTNSDSITASVTYNDAVVAFPFTSNTWFMYYDKSVFSDEDIKSFDTMLEKGKVAFPLSDSWYIQAFYVGNGCSLFGDGTDAAAGIDFDGEKAAAVTDYLVDVVANPNFINDADGAGLAGLRDGSVNAVFSGTWNAEAVKEALGDNMGVAALPSFNLNGTDGSVTIIGAVSPQGGDFSEPVTQNTKRFVRCFWGLDKSLAYARHFPAIHWLTSYSEYLNDLSHWYQDNVSPKFVDYRNRLMALLNQESSLLEIVKLIGSDVLPDDQKLVLEIARVIRLGFLQQNAFHPDDTCVSMEKQFLMMDTILYLYKQARTLVTMGHPMSVLKSENIFDRVIAIKYDVPNDRPDIDAFYQHVLEKNA